MCSERVESLARADNDMIEESNAPVAKEGGQLLCDPAIGIRRLDEARRVVMAQDESPYPIVLLDLLQDQQGINVRLSSVADADCSHIDKMETAVDREGNQVLLNAEVLANGIDDQAGG